MPKNLSTQILVPYDEWQQLQQLRGKQLSNRDSAADPDGATPERPLKRMILVPYEEWRQCSSEQQDSSSNTESVMR